MQYNGVRDYRTIAAIMKKRYKAKMSFNCVRNTFLRTMKKFAIAYLSTLKINNDDLEKHAEKLAHSPEFQDAMNDYLNKIWRE